MLLGNAAVLFAALAGLCIYGCKEFLTVGSVAVTNVLPLGDCFEDVHVGSVLGRINKLWTQVTGFPLFMILNDTLEIGVVAKPCWKMAANPTGCIPWCFTLTAFYFYFYFYVWF